MAFEVRDGSSFKTSSCYTFHNAYALLHRGVFVPFSCEHSLSAPAHRKVGRTGGGAHAEREFRSSYLVDPASSHMLVSKIKPCMSKYKHLYTVRLRTAH